MAILVAWVYWLESKTLVKYILGQLLSTPSTTMFVCILSAVLLSVGTSCIESSSLLCLALSQGG